MAAGSVDDVLDISHLDRGSQRRVWALCSVPLQKTLFRRRQKSSIAIHALNNPLEQRPKNKFNRSSSCQATTFHWLREPRLQQSDDRTVLGPGNFALGSAERIYKEDEDAKLTARKRNNGWDAMRDRREAISLFADHYRHI
ncbi:hypothetical protein ACO22_04676 [Paracoccidioides brasiliensis]|uniref:Uncharacterized protein n=1 Tax=Paracoccidioides brasiliensis TaxID=121759 RepID=A0A1D2JCL7_PARBR|nr:hypothetical protein ACO22_04676 [Paracoccidioides brasiliensis]